MRTRVGLNHGSSKMLRGVGTVLCLMAVCVPAAADPGTPPPAGHAPGIGHGEPAAFTPLEPAPPPEGAELPAAGAAPSVPSPPETAPAPPADASPTPSPAERPPASEPAVEPPGVQSDRAATPAETTTGGQASPGANAPPLDTAKPEAEPRRPGPVFPSSSLVLPQGPRPELDRSPSDSHDEESKLPFAGLLLDGGVPDGAMLSAVVRPAWWVRLYAGAGSNSISPGLRGGAALTPFGSGPSLALEAGHYFEGDANGLVRGITGTTSDASAVLRRVGYDFANAHLGLEFGQERVVFFVHGGVSYMRATAHNVNSAVSENSTAAQPMTFNITKDPTVVAIVPSAKFGLIAYLL